METKERALKIIKYLRKLGIRTKEDAIKHYETKQNEIPEDLRMDAGEMIKILYLGFKSQYLNLISYKDCKEASKYIQEHKITSDDWTKNINYCKDRANNIPKSPGVIYSRLGEWIGNEKFWYHRRKNFLDFLEARKLARSFGFVSIKDYEKHLPDGCPRHPERTYKNEGFIDMFDFLGIPKNMKGRRFDDLADLEEIRRRTLLIQPAITNTKEWHRAQQEGLLGPDVPSNLYCTFGRQFSKMGGWKFILNKLYLTKEELIKLITDNQLNSFPEVIKYASKHNINIPKKSTTFFRHYGKGLFKQINCFLEIEESDLALCDEDLLVLLLEISKGSKKAKKIYDRVREEKEKYPITKSQDYSEESIRKRLEFIDKVIKKSGLSSEDINLKKVIENYIKKLTVKVQLYGKSVRTI